MHRIRVENDIKHIVELHRLVVRRIDFSRFLLDLVGVVSLLWWATLLAGAQVLSKGLAKCILHLSEHDVLELVDHLLNFGALETVGLHELDRSFDLVYATLQDYHGLPGPLRLQLLNIVNRAVIVNENLLILLLEFVLKESHRVKSGA
jgi:hypothetical protein